MHVAIVGTRRATIAYAARGFADSVMAWNGRKGEWFTADANAPANVRFGWKAVIQPAAGDLVSFSVLPHDA